MKLLRSLMLFVCVLAIALSGSTALAQTYPTTTPVYIPNANMASVAVASTASFPYTITFNTNNISSVTIRVSGSISGLAATVAGSNDGTNFTNINLFPIGGGATVTSMGAVGFWRVNSASFTQIKVTITALSSGTATFKLVGSQASGAVAHYTPYVDPCSDPNVAKSSAIINVGAATTAKIVDAVAGKTVYVCGYQASLAGTTPTVKFLTGTKVSTDCDTTPADKSGAMAPTSGSMMASHAEHTLFTSISAGQICATTAGTGSSFQGFLDYVQQ